MARPLRLEFEGAVYHLMSRGSERSSIFRNDRDHRRFLELLGTIVEDERWVLHAYSLLGNHYRLLLETPLANLSVGMRSLNGRYTQWFNWRHRRSGYLFEGRFKAILVEKESHLLELTRYVVLNPVRAKLVKSPADWPWSNYRATAGFAAAPSWLETDWTLAQFGRNRSAAREAYRKFVAEGKGLPSPLVEVRGQIYLGSPSFVNAMSRRLEEKREDEELPLVQRRPVWLDIERIRRAVAAELGVDTDGLVRRRGGEDKMAAVYLARKLSGLKAREVASAFGLKTSRVSNVVHEIESGARPELARTVEKLRRKLGERLSV